MKKYLKIALVAPPFGDTGGPEVVVQNLAQSLLELGQDVTLFAPADWKTPAKHIPTLEKSLWNMKDFKSQSEKVRRNFIVSSQIKILACQDDFDVIHVHSQTYAYILAKNLTKPCIVSFHSKIPSDLFDQLRKTPAKLVSLSNYQRGKLKTDATIYNGIPTNRISPSFKPGKYLISIGRLSDQKGIDIAIKIALRAKQKLIFFGRIGNTKKRQGYFNKKIKPYIDNKQIIYKREVSHEKIYEYLREASALIFSLRKPEVCPMVVLEALACGTPVIGTKISPLPEIFKGSQNKGVAYLSDNLASLSRTAKNTGQFDRKKCRLFAEKYFDSKIMAQKYLDLYRKNL